MSGEDTQALWDAVEDLRDKQSLALAQLAEIKALLGERCQGRAQRLDRLEQDVALLDRRMDALERSLVRLGVVVGGFTAVLASAATAACMQAARLLF